MKRYIKFNVHFKGFAVKIQQNMLKCRLKKRGRIMEESIKKQSSKTNKFVMILIALIILSIPIGFLYGIISDRESYKGTAVENIERAWAKSQILNAPKMSFTVKNGKETEIKNFELGDYDVDVKISTETRKQGIYKIPVYVADVKTKGYFKNPYGNLNKDIKLSIGVTDTKGFIESPSYKIGEYPAETVGRTTYDKKISTASKIIPFEINYKIRGINELFVEPKGVTSKIKISGNWANPSFVGSYLPAEKEVGASDFSANWSIPQIAIEENSIEIAKAGVSLLMPVDNYRMALRSVKYAFLFLVLTFAVYFVFEITSKNKYQIHPIQYLMVGVAMLIFYLLMTSLSEFIPFAAAYAVSALMTSGLIGAYTKFALTKSNDKAFAITVSGMLMLLYIFLYTLLTLQDLSLLIGSLLLFAIIAAIMFATRNVDWY